MSKSILQGQGRVLRHPRLAVDPGTVHTPFHITSDTLPSIARRSSIATVSAIAEAQLGLITRRQAELAGVAPATLARQVAEGVLFRRIAHGVYLVAGAPEPEHLELRAAWLQLAPETPAWERTPAQGVVSHRSAAAIYGLGDLPADRHQFTLPERKQTGRNDVRIHRGGLEPGAWRETRGLLVTTPARTAGDLLADYEDPESVGRIVRDILDNARATPDELATAIARSAARFGFGSGDGASLLRRLLEMAGAAPGSGNPGHMQR
ncbi:MAG: type IV toxin-antitoxin system AbiEi family antitoxin domain-containing protein [Actinomycetota bacterium]|nr:type IV toxin-antitoxin system AbiEi family antitoxin domain-containing protein [Actinomycetota bacterium]